MLEIHGNPILFFSQVEETLRVVEGIIEGKVSTDCPRWIAELVAQAFMKSRRKFFAHYGIFAQFPRVAAVVAKLKSLGTEGIP